MRVGVEGFRLLALDLPGHGESEGEPQRSVWDYADLLGDELLITLEEFVVVGFSMGVGVALLSCLKFPKRCRGSVLIGGGLRMPKLPLNLTGESLCRKLYSSRRLREMCLKEMERVPDSVLKADSEAAYYDLTSVAPDLKTPVFILHGTHDRLVSPAVAVEALYALKGRSLQLVPSSHMLPVEFPRVVARALKELRHLL